MSVKSNRTPSKVALYALGDKLARYKPYRDKLTPHQKELLEQVEQEGFVVIENAFSKQDIEEAKRVVREWEEIEASSGGGPAAEGGRNPFEGKKTKRLYAIFNKSRAFDKFALHPDVLALNNAILGVGNLVTSAQSITICPGEIPQEIHFDDGVVPLPRPRPPLTMAIMVALDPYTPDNGATVLIPRSHKWEEGRVGQREETQPVIMKEGSLVYFSGQLWHGGGENRSEKERAALTVQYCAGFIRPTENQFLAVSPVHLRDMDKRLVDMLGYGVFPPFTGYVNGTHPRIAAEKLAEELLQAKKAKL
ncbi:phytanoyl-CoA dioxygenase family protein [Meredithblackwellia eburnea MCA 4105]